MEMKSILIKAVRGFYYDRKPVKPGEKIRVPKIFAIEVCASNKAEMVDTEAEEKPEAADVTLGKSGKEAKK